MAETTPQECGVRIPGRPFIPTPPGPQFCGERVPGARGWQSSPNVTDACGRPLPCASPPTVMFYPVCYVDTSLTPPCDQMVLPGFKAIQVNGDCSAEVTGIYSDQFVFSADFQEVICPPDGPLAGRGSLPGFPAAGDCVAPVCGALLVAANFTVGVPLATPLGTVTGLNGAGSISASPAPPTGVTISMNAAGLVTVTYDGVGGAAVVNTTLTVTNGCGGTCTSALAITIA